MSDEREILSALMDREPVDPEELARVLDDPASRTALVDFVRLRVEMQADEQDTWEWRPPFGAGSRRQTYRSAGWRTAAAALLAALVMGTGWWLSTRETPPEPVRVVQFDRESPWR